MSVVLNSFSKHPFRKKSLIAIDISSPTTPLLKKKFGKPSGPTRPVTLEISIFKRKEKKLAPDAQAQYHIGCVLPTSSQEPKESTEKERSVPYRFVYILWRYMLFSYRSRVLAIESNESEEVVTVDGCSYLSIC